MDVRDLSLDRFCNLVWYFATYRGDEKDVEKFRIRLWRPDPGDEKPVTAGPWSAEAETAAFSAARAALGA